MKRKTSYNSLNLADRLEDVRKELGLKKGDFADLLGIHSNSYTNYINGLRDVPVELIKKISLKYNISPDWLITGRGIIRRTENLLMEPESNYGTPGNRFRITDVVPTKKEIKEINEWVHQIFINSYPDSQFLLRVDKETAAGLMPVISPGDLLLCNAKEEICDGDLTAVRLRSSYNLISFCSINKEKPNSIILSSINPAIAPVHLYKSRVSLYKIMLIKKRQNSPENVY